MGGGSYGAEAILSLVELMTSDMFHGNILIIMAGYKDQMQKLFRNSNEGFASRFEKLYLDFLPWKAEHATEFCVDLIERSNKRITDDAKEHMELCFKKLASLRGWASARDVNESVYPSLFKRRAIRLHQEEKAKERLKKDAEGASTLATPSPVSTAPASGRRNRRQQQQAQDEVTFPPYSFDDVHKVFEDLLSRRGAGRDEIKGLSSLYSACSHVHSLCSTVYSSLVVNTLHVLANKPRGLDVPLIMLYLI
jgi:hypothetical protein